MGDPREAAVATATATVPMQKFSRYRSVRHVTKPEPVPQPVVPAQSPNIGVARTKSMSRYRRPALPRIADAENPSVPDLSVAQQTANLSEARRVERRVTVPVHATQAAEHPGQDPSRRPRETEDERRQRKWQEREDQERRLGQERQSRHQQRDEEERQRLEVEEAERVLAEQKRKDLERLQAELDAAVSDTRPMPSPKKEKFAFFSRKRAAARASPPTSSSGASGQNSMSRTCSEGSDPPRTVEAHTTVEMPRAIEPGGGGIVPQTDAPISASNAGERRVLVRCKQSSINLPITPETTPVELIYSSANIMSHHLVPSTAVLLESYTQLGLERRVRRYEHIRDIMNSWDRDTQNALLITNPDSSDFDQDLEASSVPTEAPGDVTVPLYYSQKPGKWSKRYVTLLSSGQMFASKKVAATMSNKDTLPICHLSDFDIYTPTPQHTRRDLKPPKKHCYAVKSQQKTTMFLSTVNFVHFFSSDDITIAEKFHNAVQRWRSWYLVNKMGEGKKEKLGKKTIEVSEKLGRSGARGGHKIMMSVDESPYTIGTFSSLMNMDRFAAKPEAPKADEYDSEDENKPRQIPSHLRKNVSVPPSPRENKRGPPPVAYKIPPEAENEFSSSGLLGRTYSHRLKLQKERDDAIQESGPFIEGGLIKGPSSGSGPQRAPSVKRPTTSAGNGDGALHRGLSTRAGPPKPLLDFTASFKEAPQWDKSRKGRGVAPPGPGVHLVDIATTPEVLPGVVQIPTDTTVFRRDARPATSAAAGGGGPFIKGGLVGGR